MTNSPVNDGPDLFDDPDLITDDEALADEGDHDPDVDDDLEADDLAGSLFYGERDPEDDGLQNLRPRSLDRLLMSI